jgi:hypothetical protein
MRRLERDSMGIRQRNVQLKPGAVRQIDSEDSQKIGERRAIDNAQSKEFIDTWDGILVFKLSEPGVRNVILVVAGSLCELPAELFDLPGCNTKAIAKLS